MELREIAAFLQVAQLKSFSKAARALGYSQAAVTIQIKQLEQELGIHLFDRIGKQTILTHQGMVFYDHAAAVMREISCARAAVTESQELTGALTIGTIESICASIFPDLMEAFHKAHPKVKVSMVLDSPGRASGPDEPQRHRLRVPSGSEDLRPPLGQGPGGAGGHCLRGLVCPSPG